MKGKPHEFTIGKMHIFKTCIFKLHQRQITICKVAIGKTGTRKISIRKITVVKAAIVKFFSRNALLYCNNFGKGFLVVIGFLHQCPNKLFMMVFSPLNAK